LVRLPEHIRNNIEKLARDISVQETVSGVGLFGSWSRGDATPSSDVDLLVIDRREFNYEYLERIEFENLPIDLNYIPKAWIQGPVPSEVDQKLHEVNVLYDRDWSLTNTKDWMSRTHQKRDRIQIRSQTYLVESDTYLSRATSAFSKDDYHSAIAFSVLGVKSILRTLIELNHLPISNTHFIRALEESSKKIGMSDVFFDYLSIARISEVNSRDLKKSITFFENICKNTASFGSKHASILNSLHFKNKTMLRYYGKTSFIKGMVARSQDLLKERQYSEAAHYILCTLLDLLENYGWLVSAADGNKFDYKTLFSTLRKSAQNTQLYRSAVEALYLDELTPMDVENTIKTAKEIIHDFRTRRRTLINTSIPS
jgi:predicted nucleotidyltransferase/HEPN domain-containing protein